MSLLNYVTHVLSCPSCLLPHVLLCLTCLVRHVLYILSCLTGLVPQVPRVSCVPGALRPTCSRNSRVSCPTRSCASNTSCPTCCRAQRTSTSLVPHLSCALQALHPMCSRALLAYFPPCFLVSCALCPACSLASRASWLTYIVPSMHSFFMSSFPLCTLQLPHTLSTLCANITLCALEFRRLPLLFFHSFLTCDFLGEFTQFRTNIVYIVCQ